MVRSYRALLRTPGATPLVGASLLGRLAVGLTDLPLILVARETTGSYALAGLALGAFAAGYALSAPARGRLIDRRGARAAILPLAAANALLLVSLGVLPGRDASWTVIVLALLAGTTAPPLPAAMRSEWQRLLGRRSAALARAYAFESSAQWSVFIVGPLIAAVLIGASGARASLIAAGAFTATGGLAFALMSRARGVAGPSPRGTAPIRLPGMRTLVTATLLIDGALGAVDFAIAAFARNHARPALAGVLMGAFCASSVLCGLAIGARSTQTAPARRLIALQALAAAVLVPLAVAPSLAVLGSLVALAGAPFAAIWATSSFAVDRIAAPGRSAEAYSLLGSANGVGIALGGLVAGALTQASGTSAAFLAAAGGAALAALWTRARRRTLAAAPYSETARSSRPSSSP